uniref:Uncharacterized protein n=1 Tax=Bionectria ochroleuca TaxID=29856 RepID=A0A8H7KA36_BIOOC
MDAATNLHSDDPASVWTQVTNLLPKLVAFLAIYVTTVCVYRVFFHPLARFPGPALAKISNLHAAYYAWQGTIRDDTLRCHEKYGKHVRYAPDRVLFNSAQALSDIYSHRANTIKSKTYLMLAHQAANSLTMRDKVLHGKRRRVVSQAFSEATMRSFEPKIVEKIQRLCDTITKSLGVDGWSETKDMGRYSDYLAFDIMADVVFSAQYNTVENEKFRYVIGAIADHNVRLGVIAQAPELSIKALQRPMFRQAMKARDRFVKFIRILLGIRLKNKTKQRDIFSYIQDAKDPDTGKGLDFTELSTETATMIVAGSDTTSTALAAVLHYVGHSPICYDEVMKEVRSRFNSLDEIRMGPTLNSCVYLRACIDEALRMAPPAGGTLWREVDQGGAVIDGIPIPAGYDVGVAVHSLHHNPTYFPKPWTYDPNRWVRSSIDNSASEETMSAAYNPFGAGPRSCIGKPLALHELMLTLATLFFQFDFSPIGRDKDAWQSKKMVPERFVLKDHVSGQKTGPFVKFRLRE